jgi:hypothetical protein
LESGSWYLVKRISDTFSVETTLLQFFLLVWWKTSMLYTVFFFFGEEGIDGVIEFASNTN